MANPNPDLLCSTDAENWRELMRLLSAKAYKRMTPKEIVDLFPDLREVYPSFVRGERRALRPSN